MLIRYQQAERECGGVADFVPKDTTPVMLVTADKTSEIACALGMTEAATISNFHVAAVCLFRSVAGRLLTVQRSYTAWRRPSAEIRAATSAAAHTEPAPQLPYARL
jgi:hypothetical protein